MAYGYTVHKSQGQSLERIAVDVSTGDMFSHGQLYVALSRASYARNVMLVASEEDMVKFLFLNTHVSPAPRSRPLA